MTSANVTYYQIWAGEKFIAAHRQNCMCKTHIKEDLAKYQPADGYDLILRWPDENEADHYTNRMSLKDYMEGKKPVWRSYDEDN